MILWIYDRWGTQKGCLGDFVNLVFDDELGALDYIEFQTIDATLQKGDYLLWKDDFGKWHEHIVRSVTRTHDEGAVLQSIYAINSISELNLSYIEERNSYGFSNSTAFTRLLEGTRWTPGTIEDLGIKDIKFYHETVYDGIADIISKWGGELSTDITVGTKGVTERRVNHQKARGADNGLLFTYGFDAKNIIRTVDTDDVYTRLHVFGKGEANYGDSGEDPTYGRRITFKDINDGKDYVEDAEAMALWGVEGPKGRQHSEGVYIVNDCEDPVELLELGKARLDELKQPRVSYSADVVILADAGMDFKNAQTGDVCRIRDKELDERLVGRITHVKRYLTGESPTEITLGNVTRTIRDVIKDMQVTLTDLSEKSTWWDGAVGGDPSWLQGVMGEINQMMNATGGYAYWQEGEGITVYDKPIDQNPTMCIQLSGAGFRIANSKTSSGEWDFHTFGTGDGFTADLLNVGTIRGGANYWNLDTGEILFKTGGIYDSAGKNYWNLDTGEFSISSTSKMGDTTIGDAITSAAKTEAEAVFQVASDAIAAEVAARTDLGTTLSSRIEQTNSAITDSITRKNEEIADLKSEIDSVGENVGSVSSRVDEITASFKRTMDEDGNPVLDLSTTANGFSARFSNQKLSFLDGGQEVAYVSNQKLFINQAEILGELKVGDYAWISKPGHICLKYLGD